MRKPRSGRDAIAFDRARRQDVDREVAARDRFIVERR
jgi:hypothetical protein